MTYDPSRRGPHPVGVKTEAWRDKARERSLEVEIWYPASASFQGKDLDPSSQDVFPGIWPDPAGDGDGLAPVRQKAVRDAEAAGEPAPLVVFTHGHAGYRRESTFLCTHLASHGYLVISADHRPSMFQEIEDLMSQGEGSYEPWLDALEVMLETRRADIPFLIDEAERSLPVADAPVGITGVSVGGWTALMGPAVDARIGASVPMCPSGGKMPAITGRDPLNLTKEELDWGREMATLMIVGDRDAILPLFSTLELFRKIPAPVRMAIMLKADHNHYVDDIAGGQRWLAEWLRNMANAWGTDGGHWDWCIDAIEPPELLAPGDKTHETENALTTAHFDAYLRKDASAVRFLDGDGDVKIEDLSIEIELLAHLAN